MENHEFDQALRDFVNAAHLPYAPLQWERMTERLDAHGDSPKPLVRQQILPFFPWSVSSAAACLVFATVWLMSNFRAELPVAQQQRLEEQRIVPVVPPEVKTGAPQAPAAQPALASRVPGKKTVTPAQAPLPPESERDVPVQSTASDSTPMVAVEQSKVAATVNPFILHPEPAGEERRPSERRTAFGIHGGYNIGEYKNNFTVGVSVKQRLSERLNIETGIAVVSGPAETMSRGAASASNGFAPSKAADAMTATTNLTYLQAAPSLNYRIYKGLSAGGGVDAQRLLSRNPQTVTFNSLGDAEESDAQAEWDFGLTARMDVQVVKKLRAGMMYRESVHRISNGPGNAPGRNYLMLQLSYTIR